MSRSMGAGSHHVTLREVGAAAGVHTSTVSLALRNDPRLRPETCARIQRVAQLLGYVPDPLVASLASFRRAARPSGFRATLAWVTNHPTRDGWRDRHLLLEFHAAAEAASRKAGYKLEEFWAREPGMTGERATRILRSRGIEGLLIAPQPDSAEPLALDWAQFSSVVFGYTVRHVALHVASNHQFRSMQTVWREMTARGYRRIGLVLLDTFHERVDFNWQASYVTMQQTVPASRRCPSLILRRLEASEVIRWIRRYRPDGLVTHDQNLLKILAQAKLKVPQNMGVAFLNVGDRDGSLAGIYQNFPLIGTRAVEWLIDLVRRHDRGIPAIPQYLTLDGEWVDGRTLRDSAAPAAISPRARPKSKRKPAT